jgi:hypothetical protein
MNYLTLSFFLRRLSLYIFTYYSNYTYSRKQKTNMPYNIPPLPQFTAMILFYYYYATIHILLLLLFTTITIDNILYTVYYL